MDTDTEKAKNKTARRWQIIWNTSYKCNLNCSFCINKALHSDMEFTADYKSIIDGIDLNEYRHAKFCGVGETLINDKVIDCITYLSDKYDISRGGSISVITNGSNYDYLNALSQLHNVHISVSLNKRKLLLETNRFPHNVEFLDIPTIYADYNDPERMKHCYVTEIAYDDPNYILLEPDGTRSPEYVNGSKVQYCADG